MKKTLLFLITFLSYTNLFSQDVIDPTSYLDHVGLPESIYLRNPDEIMKIWNNSSVGRRFDNVIKMNYMLDGVLPQPGYHNLQYDLADNARYLTNICTEGIPVTDNARDYSLTQASAFQYDPFLKLDSLSVDSANIFQKIPGDNSGSVFGF